MPPPKRKYLYGATGQSDRPTRRLDGAGVQRQDPQSKTRKHTNQTVRGGLSDAQSQLNKMLSERDRGRNLDPSKQTLNQYLNSAVWMLPVAPRELAEFMGESEHIADGGVSRARAFAEAFPGSCRSIGDSNHAAVCIP